MKTVFVRIRQIVSQVPPGRVSTYGQIAKLAGIKDARVVGWALHGNRDPKIPCHRVVFSDGSLAPNYSLGGSREQKRRLKLENVTFVNGTAVDLKKHFWNG